ncbi:polysaccharide biosynthesis tyrosine autokinase [Exiguobacterium sp. SH3S2]|uniref:CpsD/CapB family tyrosine-protein kinase n=1 Tax=unclassified Exiguobacterium TaxID=2644629 RepID=UPI00103F1FFC|nr:MULTISPECIES: CpsD/CapB family tyrosine-protein kinase [unclassified Exiguobacterium]TCI46206.1 polysaccharide biosynthesis tyrosine autokinase [Exiguobacterium sp. SH3S3]TCI61294.1 polysaccharide biosynthesis tyrosine autokinase [Exiguobacterium sp. SH3S2]TCI63145.1 polysaccharide biosynthesis tyrosine autokinase [Exiguobacterium sp. SH0S2]TCI64065.1 polysaccharide biosynthesis tyrosine autokinase [Exiguobacterium sp. SH3S1]
MFLRKKNDNLPDYGQRDLITLANPKSPISEQYRTIRTNLEFTSIGQKLQMINVTSASTGEGKSTTAANLAVVYAQLGKRVLLIDCDLRKPTAQFTFNLSSQAGLSTILVGRILLERAIQKTGVERLSLLTAGPIPPNPTELIASDQMVELLDEVRRQYDIVILDAPPMMQVADARLLAKIADGTILVIGCENSERQLVVKAKEQLERTGTHMLGLVLNKRKSGRHKYYAYE